MAEARPPGTAPGWLHAAWCALLRRPQLLRAAAAVVRTWPLTTPLFAVVARRDNVVDAFLRSTAFTHTSHHPNLVAGEFAIGLPDGPRHARQRKQVEELLRSATQLGRASAVVAGGRVKALAMPPAAGAPGAFDLVNEYLAPVVWRAMQSCFGDAGEALVRDGPGAPSAESVEAQLLRDLRHVGSHLLVGGVATPAVQARAEASAAALRRRITRRTPALRGALASRLPRASDVDLQRSVIGLMWVAHPATVQAGVNLVRELLARPPLQESLRKRVAQAREAAAQGTGLGPWLTSDLRSELADIVLELLRFRPPFPVLSRDVPRDALLDLAGDPPARIAAGRTLKLMVIGALFDPRATVEPTRFRPGRLWQDPGDRFLVFGFGPRRCPASQHVLEMLVSLLIGLLQLPRPFRLARGRDALRHDGPATVQMRLEF